MKIVLLGGSGQLGREWQHFVRQKGVEANLMPYNSHQLDITNYERLSEEIENQQPDVVVNCAAYTGVDRAETEREKAMEVNARAVEQLARICRKTGCTLVYYSTDYVFPGSGDDKKKYPEGYGEEHQADPVNWYGKTKWEGEQAIRRIAGDYLIVRISWLCGRYGSNFVKSMLQAGRERKQLRVVNDQWGSPTFAENVVENTLVLLDAGKRGTFHITSEGVLTWYELAGAVFELKGMNVDLTPISSDEYPTEAVRPLFSKLNTRKAEAVAGVYLQDWHNGLKKLLEQMEAH